MKRQILFFTTLLVAIGMTRACATEGLEVNPQPADRQLGPGQHDLVLETAGDEREYRLYVPSRLVDSERVPLMIVLHGGGGWGKQIESMSRMDSQADAAGFLVAYPNGTKGIIGYTWNGGDCCGVAMRQETDDIAFISALIDELVENQRVDPNRVYVTGISNGGIMAYRVGCELSTKVAGIAPIAGALMVEECQPDEPIDVIAFHGTDDKGLPAAGGKNPGHGARNDVFPSLAQSIQGMVKANRCPAEGKESYRKGEVTCTTYGPCAEGTEVAVCVISGGGHTWPGGKPIMKRRLGHTTSDISANEAMWNFFKDQPLRRPSEDRKKPQGERQDDES